MALGQSKSLLKKPKKPLPTKALQGKAGHSRGSGTDFQTLRVYDETPKPKPELPQNQKPMNIEGYKGGSSGGGSGSGTSTYQGGVSGVGGSGGSGAGYSGGDEYAGAMPGGYTPEGYDNALWYHPDALAQDFLATLGIDNPQLTNQYAPLLPGLGTLSGLLGANAPGEWQSTDEMANMITNYLTQLSTPGGQALDPGAIMAAFANADPNSPAGMALAEMTPEQVANIAMQLINVSGGSGPFQQRAMQAALDQGSRDYYSDMAHGSTGLGADSYYNSIKSGPLGSFFGG